MVLPELVVLVNPEDRLEHFLHLCFGLMPHSGATIDPGEGVL